MQPVVVRQAWALVLFVTTAIITVPILTYKTSDPGWMTAVYPQEAVRNAFGANGAWFADACFSMLGYSALLLPLLLICAAVATMLGRIRYLRWSFPFACVLLWVSSTTISSLHFANFIPLPVSSGGLLGMKVALFSLQYITIEPLTMLAVFGLMWGMALLFGFSWGAMAELSGGLLLAMVLACVNLVRGVGRRRESAQAVTSAGTTFADGQCDSPSGEQHNPKQRRWSRALHNAGGALGSVIKPKAKKRQRLEPTLGGTAVPVEQSHAAVDSDSHFDPNLRSDVSSDYTTDAEAMPAYHENQPHQSRLDVAEHLRKAYATHIGELSPDLEEAIESFQEETRNGAQHHAQNASLATIEDSAANADTPSTSAESSIEPLASDEAKTNSKLVQAASSVSGVPIPKQDETSKVVFSSPDSEPLGFADDAEEDDWSDFEDETLDQPQQQDAIAFDLDPDDPYAAPKSVAPDNEPSADAPPTSDARSAPTPTQGIPLDLVAAKKVAYQLPSVDLLTQTQQGDTVEHDSERLNVMGTQLEQNLLDFGIKAEVAAIHPGPVVTRFEITPAPGVKVVRITNLAKDIARSMSVIAVRIVEVIPGKSTIGIEIPNEKRAMVRLSQVLGSAQFSSSKYKLPLGLGFDIQGHSVVAPLEKMPHLLVAGTTGSGKSVGVNSMLISLLYKLNPEQLRLVLIDPKMLELSVYNGIAHLLTPVITDMKDAANGLRWCVAEMERRYRLMSKMGVRNLEGFNELIKNADEPIADPLQTDPDEGKVLKPLPRIVVIVDEFADMIMVVGKKVEELIARIAQKARAAGIHLVLATQRPSVDVITGLIKANVPTRIAFQVSSKIDSRTILDQAGADQLLGNGDMLFLPPGQGVPQRVHGAFISDEEVHKVVDFWKEQDAPEYINDITKDQDEQAENTSTSDGEDEGIDELFDEAVAFILEAQRVSISLVQRKFKIGYNRAARIIDSMEEQGIVSAMESNGKREILQG